MPTRPPTWKPPAPKGLKIVRPAREAENSKFLNSSAWRRLRAVFLAENPLCVRCLAADKLTPATIAHHVVERSADPSLALDPANLEAICQAHHNAIHKTGRPPGGADRA